jgi:two-component system, response regulator YesN
MDWMKSHQVSSNLIVISGFDDFDFVRQTLKHGAIDYLLKPIDPNHLADALKKAIESCKKSQRIEIEHQELVTVVNELKSVYLDKCFSDLLITPDMSVNNQIYKEFLEFYRPSSCQIAVASIEIFEDKERIAAQFIEIGNQYLWEEKKGYAFRNIHDSDEIVIVLWDDLTHTAKLLDKLNNHFWSHHQKQFEIGVGKIAPFPAGFGRSYLEAVSAGKNFNLLHSSSSRVHPFNGHLIQQPGTLRFGEYKEGLGIAIQSGNKEQIQLALQQWFTYLQTLNKISFHQYKWWLDDYYLTKRTWVEGFVEKDTIERLNLESSSLPFPYNAERNFSLNQLQQHVSQDLQAFSKVLVEYQAQRRNVMQDIANFIQSNYREISLTDISNQFHLNREHISRRFKQAFGTTIVNYVSQIRIDKAKVLLMNPHLKIAEVGNTVGYDDEKYFSRVFKRVTGLSPKDYRSKISINTKSS